MKTPDEIKKGLETCSTKKPCTSCPMWEECKEASSLKPLWDNALAYIQQLETKCHQLERERDAAVKDISMGSRCTVCRKFFKNDGDCSGGVYCVPLRFEWRGVKEE